MLDNDSQSAFAAAQPSKPKFQLGYGDYLRFRDLVLERSGLHFPDKKRTDLEAGVLKALNASPLAQNGAYSLDDYYSLLRDKTNPTGLTEMDRLIRALTIGETHFFRDQAQFDALATRILPTIINRKRASAEAVGIGIQPQLRLWSAGCATGEEAYSLAILLKELLPDLDNWRILILATDINTDALERARQAIYSDWSFRETRAKALRSHYFIPGTGLSPAGTRRYRLRSDIRKMVTFANLNLIEDDFPNVATNTVSIDLIICRNVTIYFTEEITQRVINRFYNSLVDGGWLMVGHSEPSLLTYRAFQAHTFPDTMFYQKTGQPAAWPADWEQLATVMTANKPNGLGHTPLNQPAPPDLPLPPLPPTPSILPPLPPPQPKPVPAAVPSADSFQQAQALVQKGQMTEAITALQQKLEQWPDFAPAHSLLGLVYANQGRWNEARHWCHSALKLDSLLAEAYFVLGLVTQQENDFEAAIDMFKKAIYIDRNAPLYHFHLGMVYRRQSQTELAQRAFNNVIRMLEKWLPETIIPDSGGLTAKHLLAITRRLL